MKTWKDLDKEWEATIPKLVFILSFPMSVILDIIWVFHYLVRTQFDNKKELIIFIIMTVFCHAVFILSVWVINGIYKK